MAKPNWEAIEQEYRSSQLSIRAIADKYGVSDTAIRKVAKKEGWGRAEKVCTKGSQDVGANQSANLRTTAKNIPTGAVSSAELMTANLGNNENAGWTLNPDEYGLNDMQAKFVHEYLISMDKTAAYKLAGYRCQGETAAAAARRLYRNVSVNRAIRDALEARERRTQITQDAVLKMWWDIATADVNQIIELRRLCCRYCWGFGFQYQWKDAIEFEEDRIKAVESKKREPLDVGGYGFDEQLDPNPNCPRCNGFGVSRTHFHDSRDLRGSARRLYSGIKEGKFGLEAITRNQDDALKMVAQHLGMLKNRTELTGSEGGPLATTNIDVSHLTFEQLLELRKKRDK